MCLNRQHRLMSKGVPQPDLASDRYSSNSAQGFIIVTLNALWLCIFVKREQVSCGSTRHAHSSPFYCHCQQLISNIPFKQSGLEIFHGNNDQTDQTSM